MLKGNKDIAHGFVSAFIVKAIKTSYEGEGMIAWDTEMMAPLLSGIINFSNDTTTILLTGFKDSAMVANRGYGVEGKISSNEWVNTIVGSFCVWFKEKFNYEYSAKRIKHLKKVLAHEIRYRNSQWKPKKRIIGSVNYE